MFCPKATQLATNQHQSEHETQPTYPRIPTRVYHRVPPRRRRHDELDEFHLFCLFVLSIIMPKRCSIAVYPTRRDVLEGVQYLAIGCYLQWCLTKEGSSDSRCRIRPAKMAIAIVLYMNRRFRIRQSSACIR